MPYVFARLYRRINRSPLPTVLIWALLVIICIVFALSGFGLGNVWNRTEGRIVSIPGSQSYRAQTFIDDNKTSNYQVYLLIKGVDMEKQRKEINDVLQTSAKEIQNIPGVLPAGVLHPFAAGSDTNNPVAKQLASQFIAADKHGLMMVVLLDLSQFPDRSDNIREMTEAALGEVAADMSKFAPQARGIVTDSYLDNQTLSNAAYTDSTLSSVVALIAILVVLFLAFGRLGITLLALAATITGWAISRATVNLGSLIAPPSPEDPALVTMLSVGIITGYTIILISRARASLVIVKYTAENPRVRLGRSRRRHRRKDNSHSPLNEVFTHTGPALGVSTALIILGLSVVALFPANNLRWVALVSMCSILGCFAAAATLVPAMLYLASSWLEMPRPTWHRRFFAALTSGFARLKTFLSGVAFWKRFQYPRRAGIALTLAVLALLAFPTFGISWHTSSQDNFPPHTQSATFKELRSQQYGNTGSNPDIQVLAKTTAANLAAWAPRVGAIKGVTATTVDPQPYAGSSVLDVSLHPSLSTREATDVVRAIRALPSNFTKQVTGQAANQLDFGHQLTRFVPPLALVMMLATFIVILRATKRPWAAFWATLMNALNILVALGITAIVFQDGFLSFLPFLTKTGGVEPSVAVLLSGYGFALSLDYQFYAMSKRPVLPGEANVQDDSLLRELTQTRGTLWTRTIVYLVLFLSFLPMNGVAGKQSAFALAILLLLNWVFSSVLLSPLLEPFLDQTFEDKSDLIWKDQIPAGTTGAIPKSPRIPPRLESPRGRHSQD